HAGLEQLADAERLARIAEATGSRIDGLESLGAFCAARLRLCLSLYCFSHRAAPFGYSSAPPPGQLHRSEHRTRSDALRGVWFRWGFCEIPLGPKLEGRGTYGTKCR